MSHELILLIIIVYQSIVAAVYTTKDERAHRGEKENYKREIIQFLTLGLFFYALAEIRNIIFP